MFAFNNIFNDSVINRKFFKALLNPQITTISFDIFDTLFFRKCGTPENIFKLMGDKKCVSKYFIDSEVFKSYRINSERQAFNNKVTEDISLQDIYKYLPIDEDKKSAIYALELEIEKENLILNKHIYHWLTLAKEHGKKIILTSDMYLSLEEITLVALSKMPEQNIIDKYYISSEIGYRKSTGNLYQYFLKDNNICASEVLHIGDNQSSDINIANAIGLTTIHYNYDQKFRARLENESIYLKGHHIEKDYNRLLSYMANPYQDEQKEFFYHLGSSIFGPLLWEFSIWLQKIKKEQGIEKLNFFMREGFTFEKAFKLIYPNTKTQTIKVSRESTNFLMLNPDNIEELNLSNFRSFTVADFYEMFFLKITDTELFSSRNEKLIDNKLKQQVFNDISNRRKEIQSIIKSQHQALTKYFETLGVNGNSTFIDFGGGGTVFKRLNTNFFNSEKSKVDILFYSHQEGVKKLLEYRTIPFLPYNKVTSEAIETIKRTPSFIEILLNGFNYSTSKYEVSEGSLKIVEKKLTFFNKNLDYNLKAFFTGIERFIKIMLIEHKKISLYNKEYLTLLLARIIALPTKEEAQTLGKLKYDEGKGGSNSYPIVDNIAPEPSSLTELYLDYINAPFKSLIRYPWLPGYITLKSPNLIKRFYGISQSQNEKAIKRILTILDDSKINSVCIYAAGEFFEMLLPHLNQRGIVINKVIDSRAAIKSFMFLGYNVIDLEKANLDENDIIIIASAVFHQEISDFLVKHRVKSTVI